MWECDRSDGRGGGERRLKAKVLLRAQVEIRVAMALISVTLSLEPV